MTHNKLIVKNSVFMAMRMVVTMAISLITSRVVLQQLGVIDFGIFSVVGSLTVFMAFFNSALAAAIQRFMNVELGVKGPRNMQSVFAACWVCVLLITVCFFVAAEGVGLWFLHTKLSIPPERMADAGIAFQLSLLIVVLEILRVPYNSLIVAHEHMSFYAYNSIVEAVLKLAVVVSLALLPGTKLLVYMWLLVAVAVVINLSYVWFCRKTFPDIKFSVRGSRGRVKEIGKFTGWNLLTSLSDIAYQQGSAMILNIFFGVALNATMGIANQVKTAVFSFTKSVQVAANPQIVKSYSAGEHDEFVQLFLRISRISFFFVLFLGFPILVNTSYILDLWLSVVPPMGDLFVKLMIVFCIIDSLTGPLWITMQASGQIARYQIVVSAVWLCCLPIIWYVFKIGMEAYWMMWVLIGINALLLCVRVGFSSRYCRIRVGQYVKGVLLRVVAVTVVGCVIPLFLSTLFGNDLLRLVVSSVAWCVTMPFAVYLLGITASERKVVDSLISKYLPGRKYKIC